LNHWSSITSGVDASGQKVERWVIESRKRGMWKTSGGGGIPTGSGPHGNVLERNKILSYLFSLFFIHKALKK
jgi:hypothetical protein